MIIMIMCNFITVYVLKSIWSHAIVTLYIYCLYLIYTIMHLKHVHLYCLLIFSVICIHVILYSLALVEPS